MPVLVHRWTQLKSNLTVPIVKGFREKVWDAVSWFHFAHLASVVQTSEAFGNCPENENENFVILRSFIGYVLYKSFFSFQIDNQSQMPHDAEEFSHGLAELPSGDRFL